MGPDNMVLPTDDGLYILDCDAADDSIGCVLGQKWSNVREGNCIWQPNIKQVFCRETIVPLTEKYLL